MKRRSWLAVMALSLSSLVTVPAWAQAEAPDAMVKRLSNEVLSIIKTDPAVRDGDMSRIVSLVDSKIMPNVNFERLTTYTVGQYWTQATPEQRKQLQDEFKTLLLRTYSGALGEVKDQTLSFKPFRARPEDTEVVVRSEVRSANSQPVQLDYRLEKAATGWKIYDINVLGVWLGENYRTRFRQEASAKGVDGLIAWLVQQNKNMAGK
ncbi:phospholipid-binding protein MlaC [Hydrogenophaga sp.]|uniref:MlaC/ttg2D family ABC transporter substrate-binding protein n=1 Tax=Hydrogenophaga sp. TaxID=1904254 RepID=UPI00271F7EAD|nr:ABC transporter substrate-binding protein [Hydrogenophaga sp.]MDO9436159.1 ABC transporter substrate-binding protein [Hydrogenophaga sp.]